MSDKTIPTGSNNFTAVDLLPKYYQTNDNRKFIQATIDQLVQKGTSKKINGFLGRENAKSANGNDIYVAAANAVRKNYQLEPAVVIDDSTGNTVFFKDYQDYINQLEVFGGNVSNHERINKQEFYSWDPHIDWDKFVNFQQYYWLPYGPDLIKIAGQQLNVTSTYTVEITTSATQQKEYLFTPNGLDRNPAITLYRGQTYNFEIKSPGEPFSIKTTRVGGPAERYTEGGVVSKHGVTNGTITFRVPVDAPDLLYYVSELDPDLGGLIKILDINENTYIDVANDILGKKTYSLSDGTVLSNGMKVSFLGNVTPASYATGEYYVEGVGSAIQLIATSLFEIITSYVTDKSVAFDSTLFDQYPFAAASSFAGTPDYMVINRASKDRNPWTRYNRWFHKDTITASASYNNKLPDYDLSTRAARPIIEFEANLKLFNFGSTAISDVDLVDDYTTDIFSTIEGTAGYNVDGIQLTQGMRVLFTADNDILVKNNVYRVEFVNIQNSGIGVPQIRLVLDSEPVADTTIIIRDGQKYQGSTFWYTGTQWNLSQQKTLVNQAPLFDLYNASLESFSTYAGSTFKGTKIFSYKTGTGSNDTVLGFPLKYQNISNIGDILFEFNLLTDSFEYKNGDALVNKIINTGYLAKLSFSNTVEYKNGWQTSLVERYQPAVRIYKKSGLTNNFALDIYDNKSDLTDLEIRIYINGTRLETSKWSLVDAPTFKKIVLTSDIQLDDVLTIKAFAKQPINSNGHYELPINLQSNPLNNDMGDFTLGEVADHLNSIVDNIQTSFVGNVTGSNNLRDLGNVTPYGTRFVQHSGPASLALYHITSEQNNIVRAIESARDDYGKFKRNFLNAAYQLGEDTDVIRQVDSILAKLAANKTQQSSYYFSDMIPFGGKKVTNYTVADYRIKKYPLSEVFNFGVLSNKAVSVYIGYEQLVYGHDYTFTTDGYVDIVRTLTNGQVITVYEYDSTDGSYVPPTPTKLGLWPKYKPEIYTDSSYLTPRVMIQGHDGSQTLAYGDYRDDLILELEKRIYNNLQVEYNKDIFDIHSVIPGYYRESEYNLAEFNTALAPSFYKWITLAGQSFSKPVAYDSTNSFTFNYRGHTAPDGRELPGYWRGIYRWAYDTDRPNMCPWEMLGFTEEPTWWQGLYGPAPYTDNNLIMWQDISLGAVKEPGKAIEYRTQYARPDLLDHIPVDSNGNLVSPSAARLSAGVFTSDAQSHYVFGDVGPAENAWRRSSYYPFSIMIASLVLKPAYTFATCLDRYRTKRNLCGQLVYAPTTLRVTPADIILPSIYSSTTRVQTAGIINYLIEQLTNTNSNYYSDYQYNLDNLDIKLSYRVGGFTSKENFNLLLDSKNPAAKGNVFVPQENYKIVYNDSSPIKKISYSGVIITKTQDGFEVKGYSLTESYFKYHPWMQKTGNKINVGGISSSFVNWSPNRTYTAGQIVNNANKYYRASTTVTSSDKFDSTMFTALTELPITGGVDAIFRSAWDKTTVLTMPYGTVLSKVQDVVDFLLGYGECLKTQGFVFEDFNNNLSQVSNWQTSTKEFMFWTTQSWSTGQDKWQEWLPNQEVAYGTIVRYNGEYYRAVQNSLASPIFITDDYVKIDGLSTVGSAVISLSPAANGLTFVSELSVADDIANPFNDYEIFKVDGTGLQPVDIDSSRKGNVVTFTPNGDGTIYHASFYLIQKEQVVILDNTTIFNDVIYNPESGYRQERIKVSGFVSSEWLGGFEVPGFLLDRADIKQWLQWVDYALGDIVQNQGYYYSSKSFTPGTGVFEPSSWIQITKPTPRLIPNWTYKASQFEDFYNLDSDNFDTGQQKIAQHLIGYQSRQYLSNIIQDNISEFQFYQGMIREKGTQNSLNKLFDVLSADNKESLNFFEEWAVRVGQYGASSAYEAVEFVIDQPSINDNPQGFLLSNDPTLSTNFNINITPNELYLKPEGYNSEPWPVNNAQKPFLRSPGYVQSGSDTVQITNISDITTLDVTAFSEGMYVWVSFEKTSWNIYRFTSYNIEIENAVNNINSKEITITTSDQVDPELAGQYVALTQVNFAGFFKVKSVSLNSLVIDTVEPLKTVWPSDDEIRNQLQIFRLHPVRATSIDEANSIIKSYTGYGDKIWIDKDPGNRWATLELTSVYNKTEVSKPYPAPDMEHGKVVVMNSEGTLAAVATKVGQVITYEKQGTRWVFKQIIKQPFTSQYVFNEDPNKPDTFAETLAMSPDGEFLAIGMPRAGLLATSVQSNGNVVCDISATNGTQVETGCVALYQKTGYNEYAHLITLASGDNVAHQRFGSNLEFGNNKLFVASMGLTNYGTEATVFEVRYVAASGTSVTSTVNADGGNANAIVTATFDGGVSTSSYNAPTDIVFDAGGALNISSVADRWILTRPGLSILNGATSGFGKAITVSLDNNILAISAPQAGNVYVYKLGVNDVYSLFQTLTGPTQEITAPSYVAGVEYFDASTFQPGYGFKKDATSLANNIVENIQTVGGSGTGLTVDAIIPWYVEYPAGSGSFVPNTERTVKQVVVRDHGTDYAVGDVITIINPLGVGGVLNLEWNEAYDSDVTYQPTQIVTYLGLKYVAIDIDPATVIPAGTPYSWKTFKTNYNIDHPLAQYDDLTAKNALASILNVSIERLEIASMAYSTEVHPGYAGHIRGIDPSNILYWKLLDFVSATKTPLPTTSTTGSGIGLKVKISSTVVPSALTGSIALPVSNVNDFEVGSPIFSTSTPNAFANGTVITQKNSVTYEADFSTTTLTVKKITGGTDNIVSYILGSISGTVLTVDQLSGAPIEAGMNLTGEGMFDGTMIVGPIVGSTNTWTVSESQNLTYKQITATLPGKLRVGMQISNALLDTPATFSAAIKPGGTTVFTSGTTTLVGGTVQMFGAVINGITLTYASKSGEVLAGMDLEDAGNLVAPGTKILYGSGDVWTVNISQTTGAVTSSSYFQGTILGDELTVTSAVQGAIQVGMTITGDGILNGTTIMSEIVAGTTYTVSLAQVINPAVWINATLTTATTITGTLASATITGQQLTFSSISGVDLEPGMVLSGGTVAAGTKITYGVGSTWFVDIDQEATATTATRFYSSIEGNTLTFSTSTGASLAEGMYLVGGTVVPGTYITGGANTTWYVSDNQSSTAEYATFQTTLIDGVISGTKLTFREYTGAPLQTGMVLSGSGVVGSTYVVSGAETEWVISINQTVAPTTITGTPVVMTVSGTVEGSIRLGQQVKGGPVTVGTTILNAKSVDETTGLGTYYVYPSQTRSLFAATSGYVAPNTFITALGTGTGGTGTYILNQSPIASPNTASTLTISKPLANDLASNEDVASISITAQGSGYEIDDQVTFNMGNGSTIKTTISGVTRNAVATVAAIGDGSTTKDASQFGTSISITEDSRYLAVGSPLHTTTKEFEGRVSVYSNNGIVGNTYSVYQEINSPHADQGNLFGAKVAFSRNAKTLVVYSPDADNLTPTSFDANQDVNQTTSTNATTFDIDSLKFMEVMPRTGRIDIFDKYVSNWVCGEILHTNNVTTDGFGQSFAVSNNIILIGAPHETNILNDSKAGKTLLELNSGKVYAYEKAEGNYSWKAIHKQTDLIDLTKIKQAYLYNKQTNKLLNYIDVIDPVLGKIAGPAEQELNFKTYYDPAIYSSGNGSVNADAGTAWTNGQVGKLWWDLRTAKFVDNHAEDIIYRNSTLNMLATGASIDIYEWVESTYTPAEWAKLADTAVGLTKSISGAPLYTDAYSIKQYYDIFTKSFKNTYYFWVKNKVITPTIDFRKISAAEVSALIANPRGQGRSFISLTGKNSFSLINCQSVLSGSDVVLGLEYWTIDNTTQNIHTQWKLVDTNPSTQLPASIEQKWFDSLCNKDQADRPVPDLNLPPKLRYGIESRPRQSMFVNSYEALKQLVERVNRVIITEQIVGQKNVSALQSFDEAPSIYTGQFDTSIDTEEELRLVPVSTAKSAVLKPVIVNGSVTSVDIITAGSGYKIPPTYDIVGTGTGAKLSLTLNIAGQISSVVVENGGKGYTGTTSIAVRPFSVLVKSDTPAQGNWSIYAYSPSEKVWSRVKTQAYDVRNYWTHADWYATGYNQFTAIDNSIDTFAELGTIILKIGQTVKIRTAGGSGWQLLVCYSTIDSIDWTQRFKVVGIQDGTLQLSTKLYSFQNNSVGYDGALYDGVGFDFTASKELRIILECLRDEILTDTLRQEYLNLFFASVRYAHTEQTYIDWAFKTSFVKAQHNVGALKQTITYKNDNLENFQDYINEVIPYRTTVREYVSGYNTVDNSQSVVTDFDLPAIFHWTINDIIRTKVVDGKIVADDETIKTYPWKNWLDHVGFQVNSIVITDQGSGYVTEPTVRIVSKSGTSATAKAFIANGKVNRILLVTNGSGYLEAPQIVIDGGGSSTSVQAKAIAIIGSSVVRSNLIKMKFDRTTSTYYTLQLDQIETLYGTGNRTNFALQWAPDIKIGTSSVQVQATSAGNKVTLLRDDYTLRISKSTSRGYTSYAGSITFKTAPADKAIITVSYIKDISLLNASDRIQYFYDPASGQLGKDLSQLMTGVDYGGVVVTGVDYNISQGWGSVGFMTDAWDSYENTYNDYVVTIDAQSSTSREFLLPYQPDPLTQINIYYAQIAKTIYTSDGTQLIYQLGTDYTAIDVQATLEKQVVGVTTTVTDTSIDIIPVTQTIAGFNRIKASTANLTIGKPVEFIGNIFGGFVQGQIYYVLAIDIDSFTVGISNGGAEFPLINVIASGMSMRYATPSNKLTGSTAGFTAGLPIQFVGPVFGGVQTAKTYFVKQILDANTFTIANVINGPVVELSSASGSMAIRQVAGTGSVNLTLSDVNGLKVGDTLSVSIAGAVADGTVISKIVGNIITINNILYGSLLSGTTLVFTRTLISPVDYRYLTAITIQLTEPLYTGGVLTISSALEPIRIDDENFNKIWIITATNATTSQITTETPVTFSVGDEITFNGVSFGGIDLGEIYHIREIIDSRTFKVSATANGPIQQLTSATGTMSATVASSETAVMGTYIADGTEPKILIPQGVALPIGDLMIFRKSTSDGSVAPNTNDIDTALDGGNLLYATATGIAADDILIDGDGYVTTTSSPAPEEVVPGQVVDAVAIKVFDRPTDGSANIKTLSYIADGVNKEFDLEQFPNSKQAVFVKRNNLVATLGTDYFINYPKKKVVFLTAPDADSIITVNSFGFNGSNVLDVDYFVADGTTTEFITKAPYLDSDFTYLVYLDGIAISPTIFKTDTSYESSDRIGFRFSIAPNKFSVLNYLITSGSQQTYAVFKTERLPTNGSNSYMLQNAVGASIPLDTSVIVRANQQILLGPNTNYFTIGSNQYTYVLDQLSVQPYSIDTTDIIVYADGIELALSTDYSVDTSGISVSLNRKTYSTYKGKRLIISIRGSEDYNIVGSTITFKQNYTALDYVEVISAYKHDILQVQRTRTKTTNNLQFTPDTPSYYRYIGVLGGKIELPATILSEEQVWITKNRTLLTNGIDYRLTESLNGIVLDKPPAINDEFEIITFAGAPVSPGLSYMQFKDMLNRTVYKRLSLLKQDELSQDLYYYDSQIYVKDAGNFDKPNPALNKPGIIEINGERIEYFTIKNNTILGQLRRGTLGTGIPTVHGAGSKVQDIGPSETIPYTDTTKTEQVTIDGVSTDLVIPLSFVPAKIGTWTKPASEFNLFSSAEVKKFVSKTGTGPYVVTFAVPQQQYAPKTGKTVNVSGNTALYNGYMTVASSNISNTVNVVPSAISNITADITSIDVTFVIPEQATAPATSVYYTIIGATPVEYNGTWACVASTTTSITLRISTNFGAFTVLPVHLSSTHTISLSYTTDPGVFNATAVTSIVAPAYGQTNEIDVFVGGYDESITWTANTVFEADQIVTINSYTYRITAMHRSGASFNSAVTTLELDGNIIKTKQTNVAATTVRTFFVGNIRLKKHPYAVYNVGVAPESPEGDVAFSADFAVDGINAQLVLTNRLSPGTVVTIIQRQGKTWTENNEPLQTSTSKIAKFITAVPGIWVTGNLVTSTQTTVPSTTTTFDNVSGTFDNDNNTFDQGI